MVAEYKENKRIFQRANIIEELNINFVYHFGFYWY